MKPNKPSSTALLIARSTIFIERDSRLKTIVPAGVTEATIQLLEATSLGAARRLGLIERPWFRTLVKFIEALTLPGILLHYIVRKRFLEDVAREGLQKGAQQVIVFGAGFDTLALRHAQQFPSVTFIEVDHPATQHSKAGALQGKHPNLHFLPLDLSQQKLQEVLLASPHYQSESQTVFIAEGLLMYLEPNKVRELFQFVARHSGKGTRFAFTFLERRQNGKPNFQRSSPLIDGWLKLKGEEFRWGIKRQRLAPYLAQHGLTLHEIAGACELRESYLKNSSSPHARLARGEYIGVAELVKSDSAE